MTEAAAPAGFLLSPQQRRLWAVERRRGAGPLAVQAVFAAAASDEAALRRELERQVSRWEILRTAFAVHPRLRLPLQTVGPALLSWRRIEAAGGAGALLSATRRAAAEDRARLALARTGGGEDHGRAVLHATFVAGASGLSGMANGNGVAGPVGSAGSAGSGVTDGAVDAVDAGSSDRPGSGRPAGAARLVLTLPALCADAATLMLLGEALAAPGGDAGPRPDGMQYADLADWLNDMASGEQAEAGRRYWRERGIAPGLLQRLPFAVEPGATSPAAGPAAASPAGGPAAASPAGRPAASSPTGRPAAASPASGPAAASPVGGPAAASPVGGPAPASPAGRPAASSPRGGFAAVSPAGGSAADSPGNGAASAVAAGPPCSLVLPRARALGAAAGALAAACGVERSTAVLVAWRALLLRLSGGEASVLAAGSDGRDYAELRRVPGPLERSLPLVREGAAGMTCRELARATAEELRRHADWQHCFAWEWFGPGGEDAAPELPFAFVAHRAPASLAETAETANGSPAASAGRVRLIDLAADPDAAALQARLSCLELGAELRLRLDYDPARLSAAAAATLGEELAAVLAHAAADPDVAVADLDCIGPRERRRVLVELNAAAAAQPDLADGACGASGARRDGVAPATTETRHAAGADRDGALDGLDSREASCAVAEATLHGLIAAAVRRTPDAIAATELAASLSFAELAARADRLARLLRRRGVGRGALVAVALPRGLDLLVTLLAVLEAGAAYLPIDGGNPPARTMAMLADARPALAVSRGDAAARLAGFAGPLLLLDEAMAATTASAASTPATAPNADTLAPGAAGDDLAAVLDTTCSTDATGASSASATAATVPADPFASGAGGDDLAYVLYTSGSTGAAKGIAVPHRAVASYVAWAAGRYAAERGRGAPVHSAVGFDLTVTSLFVPLLAGRTVVLLPEQEAPAAVLDALAEEGGYGFVKLTPAHLDLLRQRLDDGAAAAWTAALVVGGEALHGERLQFFRAQEPALRIFNEYGPTEATVGCAVYEVPPGAAPAAGPVPIGGPIAGVRLYVLDHFLRPLPMGVPGEICVAGVGLARGYLGQPALTAARFAPDPYGPPGGRLYRTGDLGRHREDGTLEFVGRLDGQVKIDGYRIELGEIEAALLRQPGVIEAAAALAGEEPRLFGYVRLAGPADTAAILAGLRAWLPPFMVPAAIVELPSLPLNDRGKLDRRALPVPYRERSRFSRPGLARDLLELELVRLWEETLGLRPVGIDDGFFDLGGNSLSAVRLLSRLHQRLGVDLPLAALFAHATAARLAALLREQGGAGEALRGPLVVLHAGGTRRPLFCVHPTGGNVLAYAALARHLGDDQPFYAIQDPRLYAPGPADQVPELSVEEMARTYVAALRAVQPRGPYLLSGWSSGGVVAFDMARQLYALGERVRLLALLDSGVPYLGARADGGPPPALDEAEMLASVSRILCRLLEREAPLRDAAELAALGAGERQAYMLEVARATGFVPPDATSDQVVRLCAVFKANTEAVLAYRPAPLEQTLTLLRAAEPLPPELRSAALNGGLGDDEAYRWDRLTRRSVHVHRAPGDHLTMLGGRHAASTARLLRRCIDEVQAFREDGWGMLSWGLGH